MTATTPSLTPHEDAVMRLNARDERTFDDPAQAAAVRIIRTAELEVARLLDAGAGVERIFGLSSAVAASILDIVASSTAIVEVGQSPDPGLRSAFLQLMLRQIGRHLTGKEGVAYHASEIVEAAPAGRA